MLTSLTGFPSASQKPHYPTRLLWSARKVRLERADLHSQYWVFVPHKNHFSLSQFPFFVKCPSKATLSSQFPTARTLFLASGVLILACFRSFPVFCASIHCIYRSSLLQIRRLSVSSPKFRTHQLPPSLSAFSTIFLDLVFAPRSIDIP